MKQPWEESSFEEGMVGDVDTARLALRWALSRIRDLESIKARLESAEATLLKNQRDALSWQKDPAAKFHIELAEHKRVHAEELKAEMERRLKAERQLTEARQDRDASVRQEKDRHERDHKEQVEHLNSELEKVGRYHTEIAKLNRELEESWILAEKHRAELAELKTHLNSTEAAVRAKAEAEVRHAQEDRARALADLAKTKDQQMAALVHELEGRAHALEQLHQEREAELSRREKAMFQSTHHNVEERAAELDRRESEILSQVQKHEAELQAAWEKRHLELTDTWRKKETESWAHFNAIKAEWQAASQKHLEMQERALQEAYRQKEESLQAELRGAERTLREQERFLSERSGEHDQVLAQKQAALEERYQNLYRDLQAQAAEVETRVLEQERRLALERSELERGYRQREAALMEESLKRDRELRMSWERDADLERARLQTDHETQLSEMRSTMDMVLQKRLAELELHHHNETAALEAQFEARKAEFETAVAHQRKGLEAEAARMRTALEAEAAAERGERDAVTAKERLELQKQEAELERKAAERERLTVEREHKHAEALEQRLLKVRKELDEEMEDERRRLQEANEKHLAALREALQREWDERGRRRLAQTIDAERATRDTIAAEARVRQDELEQQQQVREQAMQLAMAQELDRAKREVEAQADARIAAERKRLSEEEQAFRNRTRAAEERLRRLEDDLDRRYTGMAGTGPGVSVEDLVFGVAHQLRTPLAVMQSLSETSLGKTVMRGEDRKAFEAILRSIGTMKRRVEQLVEFSKPLPLKARDTDLAALLERTLILVDERCRQNKVTSVMDKQTELPSLRVDPDQIRSALLHLLFNAIEAMPKGGELRLEASWDAQERQVTVRIKDTGEGIDPESMPELMRPFFSTKPGGTGLGLAIAQKVLRSHAGELRLNSTLGRGTEVICRFRELP